MSPNMHNIAAKLFQKCANKSVTTWSQNMISDLLKYELSKTIKYYKYGMLMACFHARLPTVCASDLSDI